MAKPGPMAKSESMAETVPTPPEIAVIGGGQLARMMQAPALALGMRLRVLAETADAPAAQVIGDHICGDYTDADTLRAAADGTAAITFDHEHVPGELLRTLAGQGYTLRPGPEALQFAQDKSRMRTKMDELGIPVPRYDVVTTPAELDAFASRSGGYPLMIKTARGGYDGKGVWTVNTSGEAEELFSMVASKPGAVLLAEERVNFRRELAVLIARRPSGASVTYPVVESIQSEGICTEVIAPAPGVTTTLADTADRMAVTIADALDVSGIMAVELFETTDGRLLVNELAMRPHNTGHWTIDGAQTSQFENHLRAVLDEPLGPTAPTSPVSVMVNVLGGRVQNLPGQRAAAWHAEPGARIHLYGKSVKPGRKLGHVTVCGEDAEHLRTRARRAAGILQDGYQTGAKQ